MKSTTKTFLITFLTSLFLLQLVITAQTKLVKTAQMRAAETTAKIADRASKIQGAIKFEETFDDTSGWTVLNDDESPGGTFGKFFGRVDFVDNGGNPVDSVLAETGELFWFSNFQNANDRLIDEWLISPELPVVESGDTIYFYGGAIDGGFDDSIQVWISTTDPEGSSTSFDRNLGRFKMDGPLGNWTQYKVALPNDLAGSTIWLGLRYWITDGGPDGSNSDNVWLDHIIMASGGPLVGIEDAGGALPQAFALEQNFPNPFNPSTTIRFTMPASESVSLEIYNTAGQLVNTLVRGTLPAGNHSMTWHARDLSGNRVGSGIYLYKLTAGQFVEVRKMLLIK